jgi:hypothetical protein
MDPSLMAFKAIMEREVCKEIGEGRQEKGLCGDLVRAKMTRGTCGEGYMWSYVHVVDSCIVVYNVLLGKDFLTNNVFATR